MGLPNHLFTPAFRHRKLGLFFIIIIGIMVYIATFAMTVETTLSALTFTWDAGMENRMTVEIPTDVDESATPQADRVRQALGILRAMPDVARATPLPEAETLKLLQPWIDQPELLKALPLPTLIDVERKPGHALTAEDVRQNLKNVVASVRVDDHAAWLADMQHLVRGLLMLGGLMIALTAITMIVAVSLICRAVMATERETIALLHTLGADDNDIARHFQFQARRLSWPPSLVGFGFALLSAVGLGFFLRNFADLTVLEMGHWLGLGVVTLLVPVAAVMIATLSARAAVLRLLQDAP